MCSVCIFKLCMLLLHTQNVLCDKQFTQPYLFTFRKREHNGQNAEYSKNIN